jgi:hypothetical protein
MPDTPDSPRRRLRVVLYFLLGLVALDLFVAARRDLWDEYNPDDYRERLDGCRRGPRDLIVVGGSPVSEGIDPGVFVGMPWRGRPVADVYAMGLPGGTTSEFWHALEHGSLVPPRLVVYGITASDVNDRRNEPHGPYALMDWRDLIRWVRCRPSSREWVARQFVQGRLASAWQLFRYRNGIRLWAADQAERLWPGSFPETAKEARVNREYSAALRDGNGYAPNAGFRDRRYCDFKSAGGRQTQFHFLEGFCLGEHLGYLRRILDWADANGTTVVLVDMPVTADLEEQLYPREFAAYRAALAEVERTRGVRVLRAGRAAVGLDDRHFADLIHLNADGAARLSRWIRAELGG